MTLGGVVITRALIVLLLGVSAAHAEVYRCVQNGKTTYTDKPCHAETQPEALPNLTIIKPPPGKRDLAKDFDERVERERKARDQADREWVREYDARQEKAERVRKGIIERKAVKGMTPQELRQALGDPASTSRSESRRGVTERWVYQLDGGSRQAVTLTDGEVSAISTSKGKRKKNR